MDNAMQAVFNAMMEHFKGMILMWSGAIVDIPDGWALCDGTQGTPNLKNFFIVAAGGIYNPNDTGGSIGHNHSLRPGYDLTGPHPVSYYRAETDSKNHLPPYYALAYIMKL